MYPINEKNSKLYYIDYNMYWDVMNPIVNTYDNELHINKKITNNKSFCVEDIVSVWNPINDVYKIKLSGYN